MNILRKTRVKHVLCVLTAGIVLILGISVFLDAVCIRTSSYRVSLEGIFAPLRVVLISDLHGKSFGRDNVRLISKIREQTPDAVFLVGDMIDRTADAADVQKLLRLVEALCEIAPVYFAPGNHELTYMQADASFLTQVAEAGAVVVNDSYVDVTIAGQPLRIGGTMGHGFAFGRTEEEFKASPEYRFLTDFEHTDIPKICLAHMPDTFIFNGAFLRWDVDLVFSGHTHGGLIRIPFVGGLYAPMQEWFPEYDKGYYRLGAHMQMIITSGLAGYRFIPRVNNPPELVVVELIPDSAEE